MKTFNQLQNNSYLWMDGQFTINELELLIPPEKPPLPDLTKLIMLSSVLFLFAYVLYY